MTLTLDRPASVRRPRGWCGPTDERPFPSLGWLVLDWTYAYLPSPANEKQPLVYTDEQARRIVRWFELDPATGEFVYDELDLEEAKGTGKSPFGASLMLAAFRGPVCFDGWDADGEPVGVPRGTGDRPPPWIQIAAVSQGQTENTYGALYAMLIANNHRAAQDLRIDDGRTRLYLPDMPGAKLEPVTASAGSREGQRLTDALLDETWLWLPSNGGVQLDLTIRRNLAKMNGRAVQTANAPILGQKSVAEQSNPDAPAARVLRYARRPLVEPSPKWSDERLRAVLKDDVYNDCWWIDLDRLVRDIRNPKNPWDDSLRFWFNIRTSGAGRAVDPLLWDVRKIPQDVPDKAHIGLGFDGSISQDATVLRGCTATGYSFIIEAWERPTGAELVRWLEKHPGHDDWSVDRAEVSQAVAETFASYNVGLMLCDTPLWRTEIEGWAVKYGQLRVLAFDTNQARRFAPAVDRWSTALREGTHTHDGDPLTDRHVKAAHVRQVRLADAEEDGRTRYILVKGDDHGRIDAAVADVLAFEAAMTMPALRPKPGPRAAQGF